MGRGGQAKSYSKTAGFTEEKEKREGEQKDFKINVIRAQKELSLKPLRVPLALQNLICLGIRVVVIVVFGGSGGGFAHTSWPHNEFLDVFWSLLTEPRKTAFEFGLCLLLVLQVRDMSSVKRDHLSVFVLQGTLGKHRL